MHFIGIACISFMAIILPSREVETTTLLLKGLAPKDDQTRGKLKREPSSSSMIFHETSSKMRRKKARNIPSIFDPFGNSQIVGSWIERGIGGESAESSVIFHHHTRERTPGRLRYGGANFYDDIARGHNGGATSRTDIINTTTCAQGMSGGFDEEAFTRTTRTMAQSILSTVEQMQRLGDNQMKFNARMDGFDTKLQRMEENLDHILRAVEAQSSNIDQIKKQTRAIMSRINDLRETENRNEKVLMRFDKHVGRGYSGGFEQASGTLATLIQKLFTFLQDSTNTEQKLIREVDKRVATMIENTNTLKTALKIKSGNALTEESMMQAIDRHHKKTMGGIREELSSVLAKLATIGSSVANIGSFGQQLWDSKNLLTTLQGLMLDMKRVVMDILERSKRRCKLRVVADEEREDGMGGQMAGGGLEAKFEMSSGKLQGRSGFGEGGEGISRSEAGTPNSSETDIGGGSGTGAMGSGTQMGTVQQVSGSTKLSYASGTKTKRNNVEEVRKQKHYKKTEIISSD